MMKQQWMRVGLALVAGLVVARAEAQVLFSEDFEGTVLGDSVNERLSNVPVLITAEASTPNTSAVAGVYSPTGPTGWAVDNNLGTYLGSPTIGNTGVPGQGVADYGVDEWEGWSFVDKTFWSDAAGGQQRELFTNATGTVAVVDADEYFDLGDPDDATNGGYYNSGLKSTSIDVDGTVGFQVRFDSSWRDEAFDDTHPTAGPNLNNQAVEIYAVTNLGTTIPVTNWNSDSSSGSFKDDAPNENLSFDILTSNPAVTSVELHFNYVNAGNDWWWAIDNLQVGSFDGTFVPSILPYSEDFEGVALGDSVNERNGFAQVTADNNDTNSTPIPGVYSNQQPASWGRTVAPAENDDNTGVFEWEGWSFSNKDFWAAAGGQGRGDFALGQGVVAIADGDEWDDLGDPDQGGSVLLDTLIETPSIDLTSLTSGQQIELSFDSSWRQEDSQLAVVTADYGSGPVEVLRWESSGVEPIDFKADNVNETVTLQLDPAGASSVQFAFKYAGANDWWWAIDNIEVAVASAPVVPGDFDGDGFVGLADLNILGANFGAVGTGTLATGDANGDGDIDLADLNILGANWNPPPAVAVPEPSALVLGLLAFATVGRRARK